ncbi:MAG TPA: hypothetical protein PLS69_10420, partial [Terricaulis sp.]|nr:hypothetical protein [Terricaulis sp.]
FLWPISGGYRLLAAPGSLDELSAAEPVMVRQCTARPQGECRIGGRDAVLAIYREAVYPAFVTGGAVPSDYMELTPAANGG